MLRDTIYASHHGGLTDNKKLCCSALIAASRRVDLDQTGTDRVHYFNCLKHLFILLIKLNYKLKFPSDQLLNPKCLVLMFVLFLPGQGSVDTGRGAQVTAGTRESESDGGSHRAANISPVLLTPSFSPPARKCPKGEEATGGTTSLENISYKQTTHRKTLQTEVRK